MPPFLLKLLPYGTALLALGGAAWWLDSNAATRTHNAHRLEMALIDQRAMDLSIVFGDALGKAIAQNDANLAVRIGDIDTAATAIIRPTLEREIQREVRLSDPAAGITDGLREAINVARRQTACTADPDGGTTCPLPAAVPADR